MFFLQDLPDDPTLAGLAERYSGFDPTALKSLSVLLRTGSNLLAAFESFLGRYDLSQGRFLTLVVLNRDPMTAVSPSVLAKQLGVKPATMTGLLAGLEKRFLVTRDPHPNDRRRVLVRLTSSGEAELSEILPVYYAKIHQIMAGLDEEERSTLVRLLSRIRLNSL